MERTYNMYNDSIKLEYIKYKEEKTILSPNLLKRLFAKTYNFELEKKKDVCNFNKDEIIDMYKTMNVSSLEIITNMNSQLSAYTQYCLNNFVVNDFQNHFTELDVNLLNSLLNSKGNNNIITRDQLLDIIDELPNYSDKFILLCIFEGIRGNDCSEIRQIKIEDFDNNLLHLSGGRIKGLSNYDRYITVSDELKEFALKANSEKEYNTYKDLLRFTSLSSDDEFIIKRTQRAANCDTQPIFTRRLVDMFTYIEDIHDGEIKLNLSSIRNSGKIHYIKSKCNELKITPEEFVFGKEYMEMSKIYNDNLKRTIFWDKFKEYLL